MKDQDLDSVSRLRITAPARLHLGFLDPDGALGRRFGSLGLAISGPATEVILARSDQPRVTGHEQARTKALVARLQSAFNIDGSFAIDVQQAIPAHAGLGSGTQLALAIGTGLTRLTGQQISATEIGAVLDRGARSAIGMAAFEHGGFIIDGGKAETSQQPPPVVAHAQIPKTWCALLAMDKSAQGVHGDREVEAFAKLKPLPERTAARLCHVTIMQMLPALHGQDIQAFGGAVAEMQATIGAYFAPAQGGSAFSSPRVEAIIRKIGASGGHGIGQSSWGPTGFAFFDDADAAERLYHTLVEEAKASGIDLKVVKGRNHGAHIAPI